MSLRSRLALAAGVAVALAVIAVAVSAYEGTRSNLRGQVDSSLRSLAAPIVDQAGGPPGGGGPGSGPGAGSPAGGQPIGAGGGAPVARGDGSRHDCDLGLGLDLNGGQRFGGAAGLRQFVSRTGRACQIAPGGIQLPVDSQTRAVAAAAGGSYFEDVNVSDHHLRMLVSGLAGRGALQVALPLSEVDHTLSNQLLLLVLIAAGGIALAALLGVLVARTALAPIARFTRQTETIAANPERLEHERLEVTGSDELARLGRTFNVMLDALEHSIESQRNLVADASHELRTPIASVRANLQLLRDEALLSPEDRAGLRRDMIEELDELTALVADVVELARGSKPSSEPGEVRLDIVVSDAIQRTRRRSPGLTVQAQLEPALVRGEGDRIGRAVANLLDNAAKWSPEAGVIEVDLHEGVLTVRDHGPGFHEEDLPHVFDRFHRARDARSKPGSGLGLAIVRQAAEAHGGYVRADNAPGGGACLVISFGPPLEVELGVEEEPLSDGGGGAAPAAWDTKNAAADLGPRGS
jgi:two-component system sensor histidine kinase MprB